MVRTGEGFPADTPLPLAVHSGCALVLHNRFQGALQVFLLILCLLGSDHLPLVVAYALAGRIGHNFETDPLGTDESGKPVYLKDIWPTQGEVSAAIEKGLSSESFRKEYATVSLGDTNWQGLKFPTGEVYQWEPDSTYIRKAPYFDGITATPAAVTDIAGARVLAVLGDSVTTDHISPAG